MTLDKLVELGQEGAQMNLDFILLVLGSQKEGYKQILFLTDVLSQCRGLNPAYWTYNNKGKRS